MNTIQDLLEQLYPFFKLNLKETKLHKLINEIQDLHVYEPIENLGPTLLGELLNAIKEVIPDYVESRFLHEQLSSLIVPAKPPADAKGEAAKQTWDIVAPDDDKKSKPLPVTKKLTVKVIKPLIAAVEGQIKAVNESIKEFERYASSTWAEEETVRKDKPRLETRRTLVLILEQIKHLLKVKDEKSDFVDIDINLFAYLVKRLNFLSKPALGEYIFCINPAHVIVKTFEKIAPDQVHKGQEKALQVLPDILAKVADRQDTLPEEKDISGNLESKTDDLFVARPIYQHINDELPADVVPFKSVILKEKLEEICETYLPSEMITMNENRGDIVIKSRDLTNFPTIQKIKRSLQKKLGTESKAELQEHSIPGNLMRVLKIEDGGDARTSVSTGDDSRQIRSGFVMQKKDAASDTDNIEDDLFDVIHLLAYFETYFSEKESKSNPIRLSQRFVSRFDMGHANIIWKQESARTKDAPFKVFRKVVDQRRIYELLLQKAKEHPELKSKIDQLLKPEHAVFLRKSVWKQFLKKRHKNQDAIEGQWFNNNGRLAFHGTVEVVRENPAIPHMVFCVDESGSMAGERTANMKRSLEEFVDYLITNKVDTYITMLGFGSENHEIVIRLRSTDSEFKTKMTTADQTNQS